MFRHGDRTPIDPYPNDPYRNNSLWPVGWGQLTNNGKKRHYELGKWFRSRYGQLVGLEYRRENILVRSTDVDRTLMSAQCNLAGFFPPLGGQRWDEMVDWQPIPVHTTPEKEDGLLAMKAPCKKYEEEYKKAKQSDFMVALDNKYKDLYSYLTEKTGRLVQSVIDVEYHFSTLHIESLFNFTLPEWTKKVYPEPMRTASAISFAVPTLNTQLKRLKSGPLLKEMVEHMKSKAGMAPALEKTDNKKMWVYSAHDTTVSNFLNTLGVFNMLNPPYAATVMVELRRSSSDNGYYVNVLYKNTTDVAYLMTLPKCGQVCPLEQFIDNYKDVIPDDWSAECHSHRLFDLTSDLPYNSLAIFAMVASTLVVFVLLASTSLYWHRKTPSHAYKKLKMETL
ncbi:hypothetical protein AAG570_006170 [Ranatra chinensis]|uniref:acid phosphatase n=1 Tax=Ranatra chinensis TaxID=642074 RepID=A0ABD0XX93_9HEMI